MEDSTVYKETSIDCYNYPIEWCTNSPGELFITLVEDAAQKSKKNKKLLLL